MFERLDACPSCGHLKFENHLVCTDHSVSGESFALVKCAKCTLIFTNPRPTLEKLSAYYQSEDYISHTNRANSLVNWIYKIVRSITLRRKLRLINEKSKISRLLDFGCGTGHFVQYCEKRGWKTTGMETDPQARELAQANFKGIVHGALKEIKDTFDIITAWHVIEHVTELNDTIKQLSKRMNEKGVLIIALPNCNSFDAEYYKENWAGYDVPRHLYHFTQNSFQELASRHKLKLMDTLPMMFDAYYVSLLSEKNSSSKSGFMKSFRLGRKSNREAIETNEYSSLIYVLTK